MMIENTATDWQQVIVNLEILQEAYGYNYGLCHDLVVASRKLAEGRKAQGRSGARSEQGA